MNKVSIPAYVLYRYGKSNEEHQVGINIDGAVVSAESLLDVIKHVKMNYVLKIRAEAYLNALISSQNRKTFDFNNPIIFVKRIEND